MNIVVVKWVDAVSVDTWEDREALEAETVAEVVSVGWLVKKTKSCLVLSLNHDRSNAKLSCSMIIPLKFVTEIREIKSK